MPTKVCHVDSYEFSESDALFLDTNIWCYLYAPQAPDDWRTKVYSKTLAKILSAKSGIFVDALVISEFINRYARLEYNLLKAEGSTIGFKEYRRSVEFKPVAKEIVATVGRIMKLCHRIESGFSACDIEHLLEEFCKGDSDFNDQVMVELCKAKGFKLITHDSDFKECGVPILTANSRLLS